MSTTILSRICTACGQERKTKDKIAYDPHTFNAYCSSYYICENENHPHSPKNTVANSEKYPETYGQLPLLSYDEAKERYVGWLEANHSNPKKAKKIAKMVKNPMTWRVGSPELAEFLLDLQNEMEFTSLSDTIRFCVERMQEERSKHEFKQGKIKKEIKEEKTMKEFVTDPIEFEKEEKQPEVVSFDF